MKETYNTRTLAACAKRLRWMKDTLPEMPQVDIIWRFREGFRLQVAGEHHEPGGCLAFMGVEDRVREIGNVLNSGDAEQAGWDCLKELIDCAADKFADADLRFLAGAPDLPENMRYQVVREINRRAAATTEDQ